MTRPVSGLNARARFTPDGIPGGGMKNIEVRAESDEGGMVIALLPHEGKSGQVEWGDPKELPRREQLNDSGHKIFGRPAQFEQTVYVSPEQATLIDKVGILVEQQTATGMREQAVKVSPEGAAAVGY